MLNHAARDATISSPASDGAPVPARRDAILFTTDFRPQVGGIAEYLGGLWDQSARWGNPRVYSTIPGGDRSDELQRTLPAPPGRRLGERFGDRVPAIRRVHTLAHFAALRHYARRTVSTVIEGLDARSRVCIGVWNPLAHFWCDALAAAGRPFALFAYGLDVIQPLYGTVAPWRTVDFRRASRVITCSSATAEITAARLGVARDRLRVVHPGIDIAGYVPPTRAEIDALARSLDVGVERVLLSVGRLVRRKGFDIALRAFAEYRRIHRRGDYIIAGDGPERNALEALASELGVRNHVRFVGGIDERTKIIMYELGDAFIMPNTLLNNVDWEGFGIVFLEAARAGKPSVGGANGGVPDAVVDGVTGLLVDPNEPRKVAEALGSILSDDALRARLGEAARRRAAEQFDWQAIGTRFRTVLEEAW